MPRRREGGLTPSYGALKSIRRGGDDSGASDSAAARRVVILLSPGMSLPPYSTIFTFSINSVFLVTGVLNEDGDVDMARMREVMSAAQGMAVTFHRAFDMCADPVQAIDSLAELGVSRILTSGQQASAEKDFH